MADEEVKTNGEEQPAEPEAATTEGEGGKEAPAEEEAA